jgi:hypothetical protein
MTVIEITPAEVKRQKVKGKGVDESTFIKRVVSA